MNSKEFWKLIEDMFHTKNLGSEFANEKWEKTELKAEIKSVL